MSGKRFSKCCQKKFPKIFKHPNSGSNFNARWMRTKTPFISGGWICRFSRYQRGRNTLWTKPQLDLHSNKRRRNCRCLEAIITSLPEVMGNVCPSHQDCSRPPNTSNPKRIATFCWSLEGVARFFLDLKKEDQLTSTILKMKMWTSIGTTSLYSNLICKFRLFWTCNLNHNGNLETTEAQSRFSASRERQLPSMCLVRVAQHGCEPWGHRRDSWFMGVLQYVFFIVNSYLETCVFFLHFFPDLYNWLLKNVVSMFHHHFRLLPASAVRFRKKRPLGKCSFRFHKPGGCKNGRGAQRFFAACKQVDGGYYLQLLMYGFWSFLRLTVTVSNGENKIKI